MRQGQERARDLVGAVIHCDCDRGGLDREARVLSGRIMPPSHRSARVARGALCQVGGGWGYAPLDPSGLATGQLLLAAPVHSAMSCRPEVEPHCNPSAPQQVSRTELRHIGHQDCFRRLVENQRRVCPRGRRSPQQRVVAADQFVHPVTGIHGPANAPRADGHPVGRAKVMAKRMARLHPCFRWGHPAADLVAPTGPRLIAARAVPCSSPSPPSRSACCRSSSSESAA